MRVSADRIATDVRTALGYGTGPIGGLTPLARALGVREILFAQLENDGCVVPHPDGGAVVSINSTIPRTRQRFTLAHELGHLLLSDPTETYLPVHGRPTTPSQIERFCDEFAGSLLLPGARVRSVAHRRESLEKLVTISGEFGVSASAAFVQLRRYGGWRSVLIRFRQRPRRGWRTAQVHGAETDWFRCTHSASAHLDILARSGIATPKQTVFHLGGGSERVFPCQVIVQGKSVLALGSVEPRPASSDRSRAR